MVSSQRPGRQTGSGFCTLSHGAFSNTARLWNAASGQQIAPRLDGIVSAEFSRNGKRIIAAKVNRTIEILDAADGKSLLTFASDNLMSAARFSPDDAPHRRNRAPRSVRSFPEMRARAPNGRSYCLAVGGQAWNVADGTTLKLPTEVKFADFSPGRAGARGDNG